MRAETTLFLLLAITSHCQCEQTVEHLQQIINDAMVRAYQIPLPNNSYDFIPRSKRYIDYGTFDHIIIGGGSAGGVIANRLSEDNFRQILLLEAGKMPSEFSDIPGLTQFVAGLGENWNYVTIPQRNACLGLNNRECNVPRGKVLGGSSTINALIYARGNKRDYDGWQTKGWSFEEVLPFFKNIEKYDGDSSPYRGSHGDLSIETFQAINVQGEAFLEANKLLGRAELDYNGEKQIGCGKLQFTTLKGERHSVANAFLKPIMKTRSNLRVLTESLVIKILIKNSRAFGVLFIRNGNLFIARSKKDVVVSAGSINSPQLLMLSGIGPRNHLEEMGIPVVQNLPVGEQLEDHPIYPYLDFSTNFTEPQLSLEKLVEGYLKNDGSLSNSFNAQGLAFLQTNMTNIPDYPDIELAVISSVNRIWVTQKLWNINKDALDVVTDHQENKSISIAVIVLHPKSRGSIRLNSPNPFEYPLIDLNMLSDTENHDIETMYQGVQKALELISTPPFQRLGTKLKDYTLPPCKEFEYLSKDYWYCQIRHFTTNVFHPIASCKMGSSRNSGAVVDAELKVFGVKNLRVADASIIPSSISGHTNAPAIMIGEKVAEMIRRNG